MDSFDSELVVVDGTVTVEKLAHLRALQSEYPKLDFKADIDLTERRDIVELAKDVGAMQVLGGYIVIGAEDDGSPSNRFSPPEESLFDEAKLRGKIRRYFGEHIQIAVRLHETGDGPFAILCVLPNPLGYVAFACDGAYSKPDGNQELVFREGDIYWREGTSSTRITRAGWEAIIAKRLSQARVEWESSRLAIGAPALEQEADDDTDPKPESDDDEGGSDRVSHGPEPPPGPPHLGASSPDRDPESRDPSDLVRTVEELALKGRDRELELWIRRIGRSASSLAAQEKAGPELGAVLDQITSIAAVLQDLDDDRLFSKCTMQLSDTYSEFAEIDDKARQLSYMTEISSHDPAPKAWLEIVRRVLGLGALSVRREDWNHVRDLALEKPRGLSDYDKTWLRHALTMATRAQHLSRGDSGSQVDLSLLSLALEDIQRLAALRVDRFAIDSENALDSLAQFDFLACLFAADEHGTENGSVFYPNFARFQQRRIQPIADRVVSDADFRRQLFSSSDAKVADALERIGELARSEGVRFAGFSTWDDTEVGKFISENKNDDLASR